MASKIGVAVLGLGRQGAPRLEKFMTLSDRLNVRWIVDRDTEAARKMTKSSASLIPNRQQPQIVKPWHWDDICNDKG